MMLQRYGLITTAVPTVEPITVAEARDHMSMDDVGQDAVIDDLIQAGREHCEQVSGRALCTQTLKLTLDSWPSDGIVHLPRSPVQSVTSVKYTDPGGTLTTINASVYQVDITREPCRIRPAWGQVWPATRYQSASIEIVFVAGYGLAAAVPKEIKERLKAYVAYCFENREQRDEDYLDRLFQTFTTGDF